MENILFALMAWLAANSAFDTTLVPDPEIVLMSPQELTQKFYSNQPELMPETGVDNRIFALYSHDTGNNGTIFVLGARHLDPGHRFEDPRENPVWREMILHELVHHVQWQSGLTQTWACPNIGEREAYMLGGDYLSQNKTADPLSNRRYWAKVFSRC